MQIGELYVCIIILNIMFEYLIIYLCSTVSKNLYIHYVFSFAFGYFSIYPISMVFWEFFKFNWITSIFPFQTIIDLLKVFPKVGKYYKSKDFYEIEKNMKYKIEFVFGFLLIFFLILLSYNKSFYEAILAYWILILNLGKYGFIFFLYIIYSIIFLINIYIRDFIHFLKRIIFKTKDENSNYCIPLINSDSVLTDDPFVLSMLYSIYIDMNEEEIKKKKKNRETQKIILL